MHISKQSEKTKSCCLQVETVVLWLPAGYVEIAATMGTIAEFVESLDITSEKKDDLRQHLQNLQVILSDNCQAAVLRVLLKAKGWPASFLLYDEAKAYGALKNIGECEISNIALAPEGSAGSTVQILPRTWQLGPCCPADIQLYSHSRHLLFAHLDSSCAGLVCH